MPITCGFDRREPIVCCPDMRMIVTPTHPVPMDKNPVFPVESSTTTETSEVISPSTTTETAITLSNTETGATAKQSNFKGVNFLYFLISYNCRV